MTLKIGNVRVYGPLQEKHQVLFNDEAPEFLEKLHKEFEPRRKERMHARKVFQSNVDRGELPRTRSEKLKRVQAARGTTWTVDEVPTDLWKRYVEITGPAYKQSMVQKAATIGATGYMLDLEDSTSEVNLDPRGKTDDGSGFVEIILESLLNIKAYMNGTLLDAKGERRLIDYPTVPMVRPRGWHYIEPNVTVNGEKMSATLFDLGMSEIHNIPSLVENNKGFYTYSPKMEHFEDAELLSGVFDFSTVEISNTFGIPEDKIKIKTTPLVETFPMAFQMPETLHALKKYAVALNFGRWDYIFSFIKTLNNHAQYVLGDRDTLTMEKQKFLENVAKLLVQMCHMHGALAMGGMSTIVPPKNDPAGRSRALAGIELDKLFEFILGFDGAWAAHPDLVKTIYDTFERRLDGLPNQINFIPTVEITDSDLYVITKTEVTEKGLRKNVNVALRYIEQWLSKNGCVSIDERMEDLATAEISRSQVGQWLKHNVMMNDGRIVTPELVGRVIKEELAAIESKMDPSRFVISKFELAAKLFERIVNRKRFVQFIPDMLPKKVVTLDD